MYTSQLSNYTSYRSIINPTAFNRANYLKIIISIEVTNEILSFQVRTFQSSAVKCDQRCQWSFRYLVINNFGDSPNCKQNAYVSLGVFTSAGACHMHFSGERGKMLHVSWRERRGAISWILEQLTKHSDYWTLSANSKFST